MGKQDILNNQMTPLTTTVKIIVRPTLTYDHKNEIVLVIRIICTLFSPENGLEIGYILLVCNWLVLYNVKPN